MKIKLLFFFSMFYCFHLSAQSLFVFVPTEVRAKVIQDQISKACSNLDVTVFGRAKDFHKQVKANPPTVILSLKPVVDYSKPYVESLAGENAGNVTEKYVLVSVDTPIKQADIGTKKIGVVDLLGRKPMTAFIAGLFNTKVKLKRVTKVEDLLPLIAFGSADGLFIAESMFVKLKEKSNLNLVSTSLDIKIGLTVAAVDQASNKKVSECVGHFDKNLNDTLGVDKWTSL